MHVFCAKSVGVTNYCSSLLTSGFTAAVVTIGELAKGKGLLVMRYHGTLYTQYMFPRLSLFTFSVSLSHLHTSLIT